MIKCRNLSVYYPGEKKRRIPALHNLSLDIVESEFITLVGPNGSGKSTLALCLAGLLPVDSGMLEIDGCDIQTMRRTNEIRNLVGIVFQNPDDQIITNFLDREVALSLENRGVPRGEMHVRVQEILQRFDLDTLSGRSPNHLSGGQKQKLALASVLVANPKYLILDETTSYLDPADRNAVFSHLTAEYARRKSEGFTVILITQFAREAASSGRVIVMHEGSVAADGSPADVFTEHRDEIESIGVGIPVEYYMQSAYSEIAVSPSLFTGGRQVR